MKRFCSKRSHQNPLNIFKYKKKNSCRYLCIMHSSNDEYQIEKPKENSSLDDVTEWEQNIISTNAYWKFQENKIAESRLCKLKRQCGSLVSPVLLNKRNLNDLNTFDYHCSRARKRTRWKSALEAMTTFSMNEEDIINGFFLLHSTHIL